MSAENIPPANISPEEFNALIEAQLREPRPKWAKFAVARVLNVVFPSMPAGKWLECLDKPDAFAKALSDSEKPWILGRIARAQAEIERIGPEKVPFLNNIPWVLKMKIEDGKFSPEGGDGLRGLVHREIGTVLQQSIEEQLKFWRPFASGFERDFAVRPQDRRAVLVYLFLTIHWREAQACQTIRELFNFVVLHLPKQPCPEGVDPIDFEDRQIKWFEKLCHRNLGLSLRKRGRPGKTNKYPQSKE